MPPENFAGGFFVRIQRRPVCTPTCNRIAMSAGLCLDLRWGTLFRRCLPLAFGRHSTAPWGAGASQRVFIENCLWRFRELLMANSL
jgi:hypothetical protein